MAATKVRKRDTGEAGNKGEFGSLHRGESQVEVQVDEKPVEYSFLEKFEEMADQYEHDFEGFPNSFANADLRGKYLPAPGGDPKREERFMRANHAAAIPQRMALAVSSTSDLKMSDEDVEALAERHGMTNLRRIDPVDAKGLKLGERSWVADYEGSEVAISGASAGSKNMRDYTFRRNPTPPFEKRKFTHLDIRALAAFERIDRKTGVDLMPIVTGAELARRENRFLTPAENPEPDHNKRAGENRTAVMERHVADVSRAFSELEDAQSEARNFKAQAKYMKAKQGSVATAWQDKKNPDKVHAELARSTSMARDFAKVEIDNDVDPEQFRDFETAWEDAKTKLPPIPAGREPSLRIRYLGKHKATGVFFPHANTIAVDVRDSSSFVHEYGHYVDLVTKDNASVGRGFREVVDSYSRSVKMPPGMETKSGYYSTPTEVYARGFEMYAHERLGVDNRLLRKDKFDRFDFEPFQRNPELKEKMFGLFDEAFGKGR